MARHQNGWRNQRKINENGVAAQRSHKQKIDSSISYQTTVAYTTPHRK